MGRGISTKRRIAGNRALVLVVALLAPLAVAAGQAKGDSFTRVSCWNWKLLAQKEAGARVALDSFSIDSPGYGDWCTVLEDGTEAQYLSHPLFGYNIVVDAEDDRLLNTLVLVATYVHLGEAPPPADVAALQAFVADWIEAGFHVEIRGGVRHVDLTSRSRFTLRESRTWAQAPAPQGCVAYEYRMTERRNPQAPGKTFQLHDSGAICSDPADAQRLILVGLSERHVKQRQLRPELFEAYRTRVLVAMLESLRFE